MLIFDQLRKNDRQLQILAVSVLSGLGILLLLDVVEPFEVAGRGRQRQLLGNQEVAGVAVGHIADLAPTTDLRDIVQQNHFHGGG